MAVSGTTSGPELLVELDRADQEPLHRQLANGLRTAIRRPAPPPPGWRPSTRRARRNTLYPRDASTSTSSLAHRISAASPATRGCGRCGRGWPRSARTRSVRRPARASCRARRGRGLSATHPRRESDAQHVVLVRARRRRSHCSDVHFRTVRCRWRWKTLDSGCIGWCCATTASNRSPFRSTTTASMPL